MWKKSSQNAIQNAKFTFLWHQNGSSGHPGTGTAFPAATLARFWSTR
jgi:hypothetical protein